MVVKSGTFYVVVVVVYGVVKSVIGLETTEIVTDITFCQWPLIRSPTNWLVTDHDNDN